MASDRRPLPVEPSLAAAGSARPSGHLVDDGRTLTGAVEGRCSQPTHTQARVGPAHRAHRDGRRCLGGPCGAMRRAEDGPPGDAQSYQTRAGTRATRADAVGRSVTRNAAMRTLAGAAKRHLPGPAGHQAEWSSATRGGRMTSPRTSAEALAGVAPRHLPMCSPRRGDHERRTLGTARPPASSDPFAPSVTTTSAAWPSTRPAASVFRVRCVRTTAKEGTRLGAWKPRMPR